MPDTRKIRSQAVLLIHGIGEQRPLETLRGFVDAAWTSHSEIHNSFGAAARVWSRPDRVSGSYELRRFTTGRNKAGIRTDFFELYWAHLLQGTTISQFTAWFRTLLLRNPFRLPPTLRPAWVLVVALLAGVFFASRAFDPPAWVSIALTVAVAPVVESAVRKIAGDAARYLNPAPDNIKARMDIREAGVELLANLHDRGYDRIIVVGHSLGSVIGYDVLTHAYPSYHRTHGFPEEPEQRALGYAEKLAREADDVGVVDIDAWQAAQRALFEEQVALGSRWRVSDFISLGSPLAHAEVLLASDKAALQKKVGDRELPSCPPVLEQPLRGDPEDRAFSFAIREEDAQGRKTQLRVPHHAAPFASTRWTNIYFPARLALFGDVIAGPVAPELGPGVRDVAVATEERGGLLSHTLYWSTGTPTPRQTEALRRALDLVDARGR